MIAPHIAEKLGFYVYAYIDPRDGAIFYVGKGVSNRAFAHLDDRSESEKVVRIAAIRAAGREPQIDFIAYGLASDDEACRIEAALIDVLPNLTNKVRGIAACRMTLEEAKAHFAAEVAEITEPALLIRINRLYRSTMSALELYEATRGIWVIGADRRQRARLAMPVFNGVVREVYEIESWHRAATTQYTTRTFRPENIPSRWEFVGRPAGDELRNRYRYKRFEFPQGLQSPIVGVNL